MIQRNARVCCITYRGVASDARKTWSSVITIINAVKVVINNNIASRRPKGNSSYHQKSPTNFSSIEVSQVIMTFVTKSMPQEMFKKRRKTIAHASWFTVIDLYFFWMKIDTIHGALCNAAMAQLDALFIICPYNCNWIESVFTVDDEQQRGRVKWAFLCTPHHRPCLVLVLNPSSTIYTALVHDHHTSKSRKVRFYIYYFIIPRNNIFYDYNSGKSYYVYFRFRHNHHASPTPLLYILTSSSPSDHGSSDGDLMTPVADII